jgi:hypothetical protein
MFGVSKKGLRREQANGSPGRYRHGSRVVRRFPVLLPRSPGTPSDRVPTSARRGLDSICTGDHPMLEERSFEEGAVYECFTPLFSGS